MKEERERKKKTPTPPAAPQPVGSFSFQAHSTRELLLSLSLWFFPSYKKVFFRVDSS